MTNLGVEVGLFRSGVQDAERGFRAGDIRTLVATTTLAQGVNLPARAVIIRDITLGIDSRTIADALLRDNPVITVLQCVDTSCPDTAACRAARDD